MWYNFTQLCRFKRNHFINVLNGPIIALINLTPLIKLPCSLSRLKSNPDQVRQTKYNLLDPQQLFFRMSKRDKQKTKNKTKSKRNKNKFTKKNQKTKKTNHNIKNQQTKQKLSFNVLI